MEEIKVGEYIRTSEGYIGKYIKDASVKGVIIVEDNEMTFPTGKHNISKHSPNIIDLIEEGDYVNGYKVLNLDVGYVYVDCTKLGTNRLKTFTNYQIKSIVTKEQYEAIEYKLEELG